MNKINCYEECSNHEQFSSCNNRSTSDFCIDDDCSVSKKVHYNACEIFKKVDCETINLDRCTSRILKVNVCLKNICFGREVTLGCIVYDKCGRILAFKSDTFTINKDKCDYHKGNSDLVAGSECCSSSRNLCGSAKRKFTFILPVHDICNPMDVNIKILANYTSIDD